MSDFKAKDIFRASGSSLLRVSNSHVENDRNKILAGRSLSPLLLVRASAHDAVIIAEGYHRLLMPLLPLRAKARRWASVLSEWQRIVTWNRAWSRRWGSPLKGGLLSRNSIVRLGRFQAFVIV